MLGDSGRSCAIYHRLGGGLFRTLIAAKYSPFSVSFRKSSRCPDFTQNADNPHPRLDSEKGSISETHGLPMGFLNFGKKNAGSLSPSREALFRTLITAKIPPIFGTITANPRGPDFYPKLGNRQMRLTRKKGAILETHGLPVIS